MEKNLTDPDIAAEFLAKIGVTYASLLTTHLDIECFNNQSNEHYISTAEEVFGRTKSINLRE